MLAALLSRSGPLPATNPSDQENIRSGHIYVCRPDHHLTIEDGQVRLLRGPRENRHRPAIDPLFRTAARVYGPRVVGIVLSGLQDDGSAGLYAIKQRGGIAIVQDPEDAVWKDMPEHAIEYVSPDYVLPARDIAPFLVKSVKTPKSELVMAKKNSFPHKSNSKKNNKNNKRMPASQTEPDANEHVAYFEEGQGNPSVFACPECHGVLWELKDGKIVRFRCRVGHSYGIESLNQKLSEASEDVLWAAVRALEEKAALQRRVAEGMRLDRRMSSRLLDQSDADTRSAHLIRDMIFRHNAKLEKAEEEPKKASSDKKSRGNNRKTA